jgi:hypothetical protein
MTDGEKQSLDKETTQVLINFVSDATSNDLAMTPSTFAFAMNHVGSGTQFVEIFDYCLVLLKQRFETIQAERGKKL